MDRLIKLFLLVIIVIIIVALFFGFTESVLVLSATTSLIVIYLQLRKFENMNSITRWKSEYEPPPQHNQFDYHKQSRRHFDDQRTWRREPNFFNNFTTIDDRLMDNKNSRLSLMQSAYETNFARNSDWWARNYDTEFVEQENRDWWGNNEF